MGPGRVVGRITDPGGVIDVEILLLNYDYPAFLSWFYDEHPGLEDASYQKQAEARRETLMSGAVFYAKRLRERGHEVHEIYPDNENMQFAWARDHGHDISQLDEDKSEKQRREGLKRVWQAISDTPLRHLRRLVYPFFGDNVLHPDWYFDVMEAQIEHYQPDVLYCRTLVDSEFIKRVRPHVGAVVGEIGTTIPDNENLDVYDLIFSLLPPVVEELEHRGVASEHVRRGFGQDILERLDDGDPDIQISFVGSLTSSHEQRIKLLERLCRETPIRIWGTGVESLDEDSPIHDHYQGAAWGIEMYRILSRSKVTVNSHIDIAGDYAANHRLFEATGVGTALVTDRKSNLPELFEPGEELLAYSSPTECVSQIKRLHEGPETRARLAEAGQQRTLGEHTYEARIDTIVDSMDEHC